MTTGEQSAAKFNNTKNIGRMDLTKSEYWLVKVHQQLYYYILVTIPHHVMGVPQNCSLIINDQDHE